MDRNIDRKLDTTVSKLKYGLILLQKQAIQTLYS